jgi:hypothetical protein
MDQTDTIDIPENAPDPTVGASEPAAVAVVDDTMRTFLGELARAMQAAAQRERTRIAGVVAEAAIGQIDVTRKRASAEAEELRRLAGADLERIQAWSDAEVERIRAEAERRSTERQSDLEAYLAQHDSIIATEIEGVDTAVREYDATLARFFDELAGMTDPTELVRQAGSLPPVPDLDAVRAAARAGAVATFAQATRDDPGGSGGESGDGDSAGESEGVGVMDPESVGRADGLPDAPIGRDDDPESPPAPAADPLYLGGDAGEEATARTDQANAAVRVLRTIAPWTAPWNQGNGERGESPH